MRVAPILPGVYLGQKAKSVAANGKAWREFDADGMITAPGGMGKVSVVASY